MDNKHIHKRKIIIKNDEIDLIALVRTINEGKKKILYSIVICFVIGLLIAFFSPKKYTASATLLPSNEKGQSSLGSLSSLASLAGISTGNSYSSDNIPSDLYPKIVESFPFLHEFIYEKFYFEDIDKTISIYDYVCQDTIESFGTKLFKYTIGLPMTIRGALAGPPKLDAKPRNYGVLRINNEEKKALGTIQGLFTIDVEAGTGLVTVSVESDNPILAAQYVNKGIELLQKYIINYKTKQAKENLDFIQQRFDEKKAEYEAVQESFFNYKDKHRNIISERINIDYQRLSDNYDVLSTVYKNLAQQLEQAKISVKNQTPVYNIIEPVTIPDRKSSPNVKVIILVSLFLGVFLGISIVVLVDVLFVKKEE